MVQTFLSKVKATNVSQPDSVTCQASCIVMALGWGPSEVRNVRNQLLQGGTAGDPSNMGRLLRQHLGRRYSLDLDASLKDCKQWVKDGEFLITHGWFTRSGHVICLDALEVKADMVQLSYRFSVKDPWAEFDFINWRYLPGSKFYDGFYSSYGLYAACVAGQSSNHAYQLYKRGELDSNRGGMWVHRIRPAA